MNEHGNKGYYYDRFYKRESDDKPSFGPEPTKELRRLILMGFKGERAFDLGCGDGRNSLFLAQNRFQVTALDNSKSAIDKLSDRAREMGVDKRVETVCEDVRKFSMPDQKYNLAVAITLYDHLPQEDIEDTFVRTVESLKEGGVLVAKVHTIDDPGARKDKENSSELSHMVKHYFDRSEFFDLASKYLNVLDYREISEKDLTHGKPHDHCFAIVTAKKK